MLVCGVSLIPLINFPARLFAPNLATNKLSALLGEKNQLNAVD